MTVVGLQQHTLIETMRSAELLTEEQADRALRSPPANPNERLDQRLVRLGLADDVSLLNALAVQKGLEFVRIKRGLGDRSMFDVLDKEWARSHSVLPLYSVFGEFTVAVSDPTDIFTIDNLGRLTGLKVRLVVAPLEDIEKGLSELGAAPSSLNVDDILDDVGAEEDDEELVREEHDDAQNLDEIAGLAPVVRLVNRVIKGAIAHGASDIHIEPDENVLRLRFRIDGILREAEEMLGTARLPPRFAPAIVSRVKIMAGLDIAERRVPQDGRIPVSYDNKNIDLRVSTLPTSFGEKVVMRILDRSNVLRDLSGLGLSPAIEKGLADVISRPNGVLLVTGPTGSGKTTTLYAALATINSVERNMCTVEDPTEYMIPMVNQIQVNERAGLTFASALRALLRQDPDVIMVGEIRDRETAQICIEASLTGHLVLSTLHTNDAIAAVPRLVNMGMESYLLAAALNGIVAQRLVRRVCPHCRKIEEPTAEHRDLFERFEVPCTTVSRGEGCRECGDVGFAGRVGVHELFSIDDVLRDIITNNPTLSALRQEAKNQGHRTLVCDGLAKVAEGLTTIEEIIRVAELA